MSIKNGSPWFIILTVPFELIYFCYPILHGGFTEITQTSSLTLSVLNFPVI